MAEGPPRGQSPALSPVLSPVARRRALAALVLYSLGLAFVLLNPSAALPSSSVGSFGSVLEAVGAPEWLTEGARVEFVANALILIPVPLLGSLVWQRTTWRDWTAYAFAISAFVELVQGLVLPLRSATFVDIVANTLGGALGGLAALGFSRWRAGRAGQSGLSRRGA